MDAIISICVICFVIYSIIIKSRKNSKELAKLNKEARKSYEGAVNKMNQQYNARVKSAKSSKTSKSISPRTTAPASAVASEEKYNSAAKVRMLMEDRENDWLAHQLREEHKAFKQTSSMFDLKIEHVSHCDARYVRQFHERHCDSSHIDTASGR